MDTPAERVFASKAPSYSHVPTNLLGKLLDHGKCSAYAVHLLAIKCGRGDGFALNLTAVNKPANAQSVRRRRSKRYRDKPVPEKPGYDIGERAFQQGIALMKRASVLQRSQPERRFAKEKLLGAGDSYVLFDDNLLRAELSNATVNRSMLIAFILTVNLLTEPMPPVDAARRFGVTSPATIRKLWQQAVRFGAVEKTELANGKVVVARRGYDWVAKNVVARNVEARNVSTHNNRENDTEYENLSQPQESQYSDRAWHDREATPSMTDKDSIEQEAWTSPRC